MIYPLMWQNIAHLHLFLSFRLRLTLERQLFLQMMKYSVFSTFLFWIRIMKNKLKPNYLIMHHLLNSQQSIRSTTLVFDIFVRLDSVSVWVKNKFCNRPRKIEFDLKLYFFIHTFCHEIKTNWTFLMAAFKRLRSNIEHQKTKFLYENC